MEEVIIARELQRARSAVFGGYRRRRHKIVPDPEVANQVFFRRPSRRASKRRSRRVVCHGEDANGFLIVSNEHDYFAFNFKELTTFDDDTDGRLSETFSSGFYDASDWSSCNSSIFSFVGSITEESWDLQVIYQQQSISYCFALRFPLMSHCCVCFMSAVMRSDTWV